LTAAECGFRGNGQGKCGNDSLRGLPQAEILEAEVPKKRELLALAEAVSESTKIPGYCFLTDAKSRECPNEQFS